MNKTPTLSNGEDGHGEDVLQDSIKHAKLHIPVKRTHDTDMELIITEATLHT